MLEPEAVRQGPTRLDNLLTHGGLVPNTMEALVRLPEVARKTANVVLGVAYGIAAGVVGGHPHGPAVQAPRAQGPHRPGED